MESNLELQRKICFYCFRNLENYLETQQMTEPEKEFDELGEYPLFVSYKIFDILRGCIGTFKPDKLGSTLQLYSLIAALQDRRFPPVQKKELPHLTCEVSLLSQFENIDHPYDWEVGQHGIEIEFKDHAGKLYKGTYLPHIAKEQEWDQVKTIESLLQKAGYQHKLEDVMDKFVLLRRYQSIKFRVSYEDYMQECKKQ
ncbi:UNKNOWN [Stylonychia lemnae]|uniref:AMMECR1 domain-containing protein n=1 Tax=Stylonychia lemnae TaxID=5949 RepID=A0A078AWJ5_STYLE|nr:UNKNOWN [Stylonychia lemnae]|eukprot:CDW86830.1 UNKNOWN [Stylonychia lemnae]